jgi:hypothetical protein
MENTKLLKKKKIILGLTFVIMILIITSRSFGSGWFFHHDGHYRGKVVELETGKPIEGAVVAAMWTIEPFVHSERICDAKETITDKNGEFELPKGQCISHPFAEMYKPIVVIFKPGYLGYPPLGYTPDEKKVKMPTFTGHEFKDEKQYYIIKLGRPRTRNERELTLNEAESLLIHDEVLRKLPRLLKLTNEENKSLWGWERPVR